MAFQSSYSFNQSASPPLANVQTTKGAAQAAPLLLWQLISLPNDNPRGELCNTELTSADAIRPMPWLATSSCVPKDMQDLSGSHPTTGWCDYTSTAKRIIMKLAEEWRCVQAASPDVLPGFRYLQHSYILDLIVESLPRHGVRGDHLHWGHIKICTCMPCVILSLLPDGKA